MPPEETTTTTTNTTENKTPANPTDDNNKIRQMRLDLETAQKEAKSFKDQLTQLERSKLDELERVRAEKTDLETQLGNATKVNEQLKTFELESTTLKTFVSDLFTTELSTVPETHREQVKLLATVEGNPVESLKKLRATVELLGVSQPKIVGNPTNPGKEPPDPKNKDTKIDPKTLGWGTALRSSTELIAERNSKGK